MNRIFPAILFALAPAVVQAESAMPSIGYTGAPADHNGANCSTCHSTFGAANSDSLGGVTSSITDYNPGVQQMVHVTVHHPTASRWGFQMTIRAVSDETSEAGTFTAGTGITVVCDDGSKFGSAPPCSGNNGRQFAEQLDAPTTNAGAGFDWTIPWTPPQTEIGRLHVYVAAVAANQDGTPQGDHVYTFETTISAVGACSLAAKPTLRTVMNGASFQPPISSGAMISVFGSGFQVSGLKRTVGLGDLENNDTTFPTVLACVAIEMSGPGIATPVRIPIAYVQADQINAQAPEFTGTGPVMVKVILNPDKPNQFVSDVATLNSLQAFAPAFFFIPGSHTISAQIAGTAIPVADPSLVPGGRPAKPGELITLYATGLGDLMQAVPPGQLTTTADQVATPITVTIAGKTLAASDVLYVGASPGLLAGLYQINLRVPSSTPNGDAAVTLSIGGSQSQMGMSIPVQQ